MTERAPIHPGAVAWAGENHCLFLEAGPDGPWTGLFSVFRVACSQHGAGQGVIAITEPEADGPTGGNLCLSDNAPLLRWLIADVAAHYGAFKVRPAFSHLRHAALASVTVSRPTPDAYREVLVGAGTTITLDWMDLEPPVFLQLDPARTSTKRHEVYGVYGTARRAEATVNGRRLRGSVFDKPFLGSRTTTAYTIFSEVWIEAHPP